MSEHNNLDEDQSFEVRDIRKKNWFWLDNEFFNGYAKLLGSIALAIYLALCRHADKNQKVYPSQATIAKETGLSRATVNEWIKVLCYFRIIKKVRVGKMVNNRYYLLDKKHWRTDWEVMSKEWTSPDFHLFDISSKRTLLQMSTTLTSSSKKTICNKTNSNDCAAQKNAPLGTHFLPAKEDSKPEKAISTSEHSSPVEQSSIREKTRQTSHEWEEWTPETEKFLKDKIQEIKNRPRDEVNRGPKTESPGLVQKG